MQENAHAHYNLSYQAYKSHQFDCCNTSQKNKIGCTQWQHFFFPSLSIKDVFLLNFHHCFSLGATERTPNFIHCMNFRRIFASHLVCIKKNLHAKYLHFRIDYLCCFAFLPVCEDLNARFTMGAQMPKRRLLSFILSNSCQVDRKSLKQMRQSSKFSKAKQFSKENS